MYPDSSLALALFLSPFLPLSPTPSVFLLSVLMSQRLKVSPQCFWCYCKNCKDVTQKSVIFRCNIKREKKERWGGVQVEDPIRHSLEFLEDGHRTPYSACGVQLKPFHKRALHVLWSLIFFLSAPFHYLLRLGGGGSSSNTHTNTLSKSSLSVSLATGTLVYFSISSASCSRNDRPWGMTVAVFVIQ